MKTYTIILSKTFPKGHKRAGEPTFFKEQIQNALLSDAVVSDCDRKKIHTIRPRYDIWTKWFEEIERGKACISIREWMNKPYRSQHVEITRLTREHGIGLQKLTFRQDKSPCFDSRELASNDGLDFEDWRSWFESCDHTKPMAIIHFTNFRYKQ